MENIIVKTPGDPGVLRIRRTVHKSGDSPGARQALKHDQGKMPGGVLAASTVFSGEKGWGKQIRADQSAGAAARIRLP